MNIFISGSTSILASTIIESYFSREATLFILDDIPTDEHDIATALTSVTSGQAMDVVMILDGDEIFNTPITKRHLKTAPARKIQQTTAICRYFSDQSVKPNTLLLASSVSIYETVELSTSAENSRFGNSFVANYFRDLESATKSAEVSGIRVLHLRFGNILSRLSLPAYPKLPFYQNHITTMWQDKKCWTSWISREDAARAIYFLLENTNITSPVNVTSGRAVLKKDFLAIMAERFNLKKTPPLFIPILNALMGAEGASLFTVNANSVPVKLMGAGFSFENISMPEYFNGKEQSSAKG
jgi:NAD dependent epimerase/dehydratase family enzyme